MQLINTVDFLVRYPYRWPGIKVKVLKGSCLCSSGSNA